MRAARLLAGCCAALLAACSPPAAPVDELDRVPVLAPPDYDEVVGWMDSEEVRSAPPGALVPVRDEDGVLVGHFGEEFVPLGEGPADDAP